MMLGLLRIAVLLKGKGLVSEYFLIMGLQFPTLGLSSWGKGFSYKVTVLIQAKECMGLSWE
jgi:hypothetical protein